jgi:poly [ADP-ribose] polymerase
MAEIVKESRRIMSNIDGNNNKFWYIYMYSDNSCMTEWGRVGSRCQSKTFQHSSESSAETFFNKKCKEKERKGYFEIKIVAGSTGGGGKVTIKQDLETVAKRDIGDKCPKVTNLITELAQANIHNIVQNSNITYNSETGLFETPCGVVTKETIEDARTALNEIATFVSKKSFKSEKYKSLLNTYLMLIPQEVGRKLNPETLYPDMDSISKQTDILDSLEVSIQTLNDAQANAVQDAEEKEVAHPRVFDVEISHVTDVKEFARIRKKYHDTRKDMHVCSHLDVKNVYRICIPKVHGDYQKGKKVGHIHELWHGSSIGNVLSILKSGLYIPPSNAGHCTGRMFGDGLYFASDSTKSLNYAYGYWSGKAEKKCFMFLADVAMGKEYVPRSYSETLPKAGYDSTWAKANQSGVRNDEFIVYNKNQADLTYLIEFA